MTDRSKCLETSCSRCGEKSIIILTDIPFQEAAQLLRLMVDVTLRVTRSTPLRSVCCGSPLNGRLLGYAYRLEFVDAGA